MVERNGKKGDRREEQDKRMKERKRLERRGRSWKIEEKLMKGKAPLPLNCKNLRHPIDGIAVYKLMKSQKDPVHIVCSPLHIIFLVFSYT